MGRGVREDRQRAKNRKEGRQKERKQDPPSEESGSDEVDVEVS